MSARMAGGPGEFARGAGCRGLLRQAIFQCIIRAIQFCNGRREQVLEKAGAFRTQRDLQSLERLTKLGKVQVPSLNDGKVCRGLT